MSSASHYGVELFDSNHFYFDHFVNLPTPAPRGLGESLVSPFEFNVGAESDFEISPKGQHSGFSRIGISVVSEINDE